MASFTDLGNNKTLSLFQPCPVIKVAGNITSIGTLPSTLSNVQNGEAIFYAKVVY